jgi:hypothetical protein
MSDDRWHELFTDAIGTEPPVGSPQAAVRRRVTQLHRRRQATGAAIAAVTVGATAVAVPALRTRGTADEGTAAASSSVAATVKVSPAEIPESEFEVNSWPTPVSIQNSCGSTVVDAPAAGPGEGLRVEGFGPGLEARAAGEEFFELRRADPVQLGAVFVPDASVSTIDRVVIGLDERPTNYLYCELRNVDLSKVPPGRALRIFFALSAGPEIPGVYKGVAVSAYTTSDGVRHPADAELGFYKYS